MQIVDVTKDISAALYGIYCKMSLTFTAKKVYFI